MLSINKDMIRTPQICCFHKIRQNSIVNADTLHILTMKMHALEKIVQLFDSGNNSIVGRIQKVVPFDNNCGKLLKDLRLCTVDDIILGSFYIHFENKISAILMPVAADNFRKGQDILSILASNPHPAEMESLIFIRKCIYSMIIHINIKTFFRHCGIPRNIIRNTKTIGNTFFRKAICQNISAIIIFTVTLQLNIFGSFYHKKIRNIFVMVFIVCIIEGC